MADLRYVVEVDLKTVGNFSGGLTGLESKALGVQSALSKVSSSVGSLSTGAIDKLAGGFEWAAEKAWDIGKALGTVAVTGLASATAWGMKLNTELETTKVSLAAIFGAQGITKDLGEGMQLGSDMIKKMRTDAQSLPGEFGDLLSIFTTGATPAFQAGLDPKAWENMSAQAMATAKALSVPMEVAAREFSMLLSGRAGAHNILGLKLGLSGEEAEKFNKMTAPDRAKVLGTELAKYGKYISAFGETMDAVWTTSLDNVKSFVRELSLPLFDKGKEFLKDFNRWMNENRDKAQLWAHNIGTHLGNAFDWAKAKIAEWWPLVKHFGEVLWDRVGKFWQDVQPGVSKFADALKGALADPNGTIDKLITLGKIYIALKVAQGGMSMFTGGSSMAMSLLPLVTSAGGGAAGAAGAAAGAGGSALGGVGVGGLIGLVSSAGVAALALADVAAVGAAVYQGWKLHQELQAEDAKDTAARNEWATREMNKYAEAADQMTVVEDKRAETLGRASETMKGLIDEWEQTRSASAEARIAALALAEAAWEAANELKQIGKDMEKRSLDIAQASLDRSTPAAAAAARKWLKEHDDKNKHHPGGGGGTNIQKVEIVVTSNQNPERIARLVTDELAKLSRNRRTSRFTANYSTPR